MSDTRQSRRPKKITSNSLEAAALSYLQRYATSAENLRRVLMRKVIRAAHANDDDPDTGGAWVDALIARFRRSGLLDDAGYAEAHAVTLHRGGASRRGIRMRLMEKGVAGEDIDSAIARLHEEIENIDLHGACNYARRRRLGPWRVAGREPHRDRELAALARQGYAYELARRVIDAEDVAELEDAIDAD